MVALGGAVLFEELGDVVVAAAGGPGERRGPGRIVGQIRLGTAGEEQLDHRPLAELRGPAERRRADVFVAGVEVGAVVDELLGAASTSPFCANWCSGVMSSQSGWLGFMPCWNNSSFSSCVLAPTDQPGNVMRLGRSGW